MIDDDTLLKIKKALEEILVLNPMVKHESDLDTSGVISKPVYDQVKIIKNKNKTEEPKAPETTKEPEKLTIKRAGNYKKVSNSTYLNTLELKQGFIQDYENYGPEYCVVKYSMNSIKAVRQRYNYIKCTIDNYK